MTKYCDIVRIYDYMKHRLFNNKLRCIIAFVFCCFVQIVQANSDKYLIGNHINLFIWLPEALRISTVEKNRKVYYPKEFEETAYHEAGHAVIGYNKNRDIELIFIKQNVHGVVCEAGVSFKNKALESDNDLRNYIIICFAGAAAEQEFNFGEKKLFKNIEESFEYIKGQKAFLHDLYEAKKTAQVLAERYYKNHRFVTEEMLCLKTDEIMQDCYKDAILDVHAHRKNIQMIAVILLKEKKLTGNKFSVLLDKDRSKVSNK